LEQRKGFHTQGSGVSIHPPLLQKKIVDSTFHYGEIAGVIQRNEKIRVLIVEDDMPLALMTTFLLTRAGCETEVAMTGKKALEKAQVEIFDLITLDVDLPDMTGFEVCQLLKENPFFQTPIVFVSGRPLEEDIQVGLELGAVDYITKPFGAEFAPRLLSHVKNSIAENVMA
jgi:two-component system alkaline phosphatase synthesis response regulator PhoP